MHQIRVFIAAFAVAIAVVILGGAFIQNDSQQRSDSERGSVQSLADSQAFVVQSQLDTSLSATYALASLIRLHGGTVDSFDEIAADMIDTYGGISSLQLAPGAVMTNVYPLAGNEEAIGHDLLNDPDRRTETLKTIESKELTLAGPFELIQGGVAVIGRLPVFTDDAPRPDGFWGLAIALIRMDTFQESVSLSSLESDGYDYQLWRIHPDSGEKHVFLGMTEDELVDPVTSTVLIPNGEWQLSVAPTEGWDEFSLLYEWVGTALAGGLSFILVFMYGSQQEVLRKRVDEATSDLKGLVEQKDVLLREVNHRVKNNLQLVYSMLSLSSDSNMTAETEAVLKNSQNRVKSMALLHDKLYSSQVSGGQVDFVKYASDLSEHLKRSFRGSLGGQRTIILEFTEATLDIDRAMLAGLIMNELVTNSFTHAFPERSNGKITIRFFPDQDSNGYVLEVADDGVGISDSRNNIEHSGVGLEIVETLVRQLKGEFVMDTSEAGTSAKVRF